jgi:hypothetical protein
MNYYLIDEHQLNALVRASKTLYAERRLTGDEMRDIAQCLDNVARVCKAIPLPDDGCSNDTP